MTQRQIKASAAVCVANDDGKDFQAGFNQGSYVSMATLYPESWCILPHYLLNSHGGRTDALICVYNPYEDDFEDLKDCASQWRRSSPTSPVFLICMVEQEAKKGHTLSELDLSGSQTDKKRKKGKVLPDLTKQVNDFMREFNVRVGQHYFLQRRDLLEEDTTYTIMIKNIMKEVERLKLVNETDKSNEPPQILQVKEEDHYLSGCSIM